MIATSYMIFWRTDYNYAKYLIESGLLLRFHGHGDVQISSCKHVREMYTPLHPSFIY